MRALRPFLFAALIVFGPARPLLAEPVPAEPPARLEITAGPRLLNQPPRPGETPADANWWHYAVTIRELTGRADVTLTGWTKCYAASRTPGTPRQSTCEMVRANFKALFGTDRVPAGGTIRLKKPAWVWADKSVKSMDVVARYHGVDANGNPVDAGYAFQVPED